VCVKRSAPVYLERRRRRWYALHDIPESAQEALGRKRFVQSLETEDRKIAERRAAVFAVKWRGAIEQAHTHNGDHIERDARFWHRALQDAPEEEREVIRSLIADEAQNMVDQAGMRAGILDHREPAYQELPEHKDAERFYSIATGKLVRLDEHLEEYLATLGNERKTIDMRRSTIKKFCSEFTYVADVKRKDVQQWVNRQAQDGKSPSTISRALTDLRVYWSYLRSIEAAPDGLLVFDKLSMPRAGKNGKADERVPFEPADVLRLLEAAGENRLRSGKKDETLVSLIKLAMYTGARIEELCALPVTKVNISKSYIEIADAKTAAGWRQVPIHSKLKATLASLIGDRKSGFVLADLEANKYGDRSPNIGQRFSALKTSLGFDGRHVFHSIRKTVATLLENAGVLEGVAADILGHEKKTMTYGLYSGGASLATKREAIEKLRYA